MPQARPLRGAVRGEREEHVTRSGEEAYASYAPFLMLTMVLMAASAAALVSLGPTPSAAEAAAQPS